MYSNRLIMSMKKELSVAIKAAISAGERIMEIYNDPNADFEVERKADNSPLTKADRAAHLQIVSELEPLQIPILSEEGRAIPFEQRREWDRLWIVDPLDGTKEFIKRNGDFTVNIALVQYGVPVLGVIYIPVTGDLYYGDIEEGAFKVSGGVTTKLPIERESREEYIVVASRSHLSDETVAFIDSLRESHPTIDMVSRGSSLKICLVAEGLADVYPRFAPTMEWDTAAGDAILRAAGGVLTHTDSEKPLEYNKENLLNPHFITR